ncbi:ABC transporter substrate-binding protein [Ketogulonicigenium vulgare]|uniref:Carbohydrate ABC transporter substrate-binding protein, CUT1 family protein n=1 Tax=Ketogulonicigenium vulgare (strain WSH-001) TaxID=759362 RepID=F9Y8M9_KETVW|nr:extracellular solute-binding protein [Ketogulonicigenium vulgare]ADO43017.1 putative substrate-binding lipoprotein [Ketogulonicigenium vulgare Y25]AEM41198.1 Carbohydrate ABC transporter substrate-binding protein, CUT1 family protein [Ketogulonicigenium vulgare WSH-001]ALJ81339.1 sugar ABC transporter substrate-binding protein [Ketogulonicigenium vulgare]ANW34073.1 sugar ABC transporter substrate-binding protein [Ketogulonicigenium vulgare]AOZ54927.1 substrate-binding lipoprotein [Ketogulon
MKYTTTMPRAIAPLTLIAALLCGSAAVAQDRLEVWSRSGPQAAATYQAVFDAFTAKTGIQVEYLATVEFETQLRARAASRDLPDVLIYDQSSMAGYANEGMILPVDRAALVGADDLSDASWDSVRMANGDYYGVPFSQHAQVTFVRRDWREALGFDVPTTHEELIALATAFATGDPDGNGVNGDTYGMAVPGTTDRGFFAWWLSSYMMQRGGSFVEGAEGKYTVTVNSVESVAAVEWIQSLFCGTPSLVQPGALTNASATPFFAEGHAGIYQTGPYAIANFDNAPGADKYEIIIAPAGPGGASTLTERTSIYLGATSTMPDAQKALAEFLISPEGQEIGMTAPGQPVVRLPVNTTLDGAAIYGDDRWRVVEAQLADSQLMPSDIDFTAARLEIAEGFQAMFAQCAPVGPALDNLALAISDALADQDALQ